MEEAEVDDKGFRTLSQSSDTAANALLTLKNGQASGLLDNSGKYRMLYCVSRMDAGVVPLKDVRPNIISDLVNKNMKKNSLI